MPNLVSQLNIFQDEEKILRARGKFRDESNIEQFPILIPRGGNLVNLIINDCHECMMHAGVFQCFHR